MGRSKSSGRWLREHFQDAYVRRAQREGYRSRSVYKLMEIQDKDRILRPGMVVLDIGAAPGGWSEYASRVVGARGRVIALDVLAMEPVPGVEFIQADFQEDEAVERLRAALEGRHVDLVMSDLAPNISGMKAVDQPRAMYLCELVAALADDVLAAGGDLLMKAFQGAGFDAFIAELRSRFAKVIFRKPKASRARSREVYVLARNYNL